MHRPASPREDRQFFTQRLREPHIRGSTARSRVPSQNSRCELRHNRGVNKHSAEQSAVPMYSLKNLTLKSRLTALVALVLLLMAVTSLLTLQQLHRVSSAMESVYQDRLQPMQQLRLVSQAFSVDLQSCAQRLADGRLSAAPAQLELAAIEQTVRRNWSSYLGTFLVEPERVLIAQAEPLLTNGLQRLERLRALSEQGDLQGLQQFPGAQLQTAVEPITAVISRLIDVQLDVARREAADGRRAFERALWLVLGLLLATIGLAAGLGWSVWTEHQRERGDVEAARARVQRFYIALSQTNQLIVRTPESAQQLYEGLCRICVETGQARLAAIVLFDGHQFERIASHGPVDQLMPGVPPCWHLDSPFAQSSMSSAAIRSGEHVLSNRAMSDVRLAQWRAGVIPPGVEAMAAFPLRRAGRVVGALSLLAGQRDFFDPAMVQLLDEMVDDASFALDNLDREQQRRQALQRAEEGLALFQRLFNASSVSCVLTTLKDGVVVEINDTLCQRYGLRRDEIAGQRIGSLDVGMGQLDRERFYQQLHAAGRVRNFEAGIRSRSGAPRRSLVNGDVIDYQGQVCVLASSIDITEKT